MSETFEYLSRRLAFGPWDSNSPGQMDIDTPLRGSKGEISVGDRLNHHHYKYLPHYNE